MSDINTGLWQVPDKKNFLKVYGNFGQTRNISSKNEKLSRGCMSAIKLKRLKYTYLKRINSVEESSLFKIWLMGPEIQKY